MELLEIVIFDEADRLLEMGFRQECLEVTAFQLMFGAFCRF